jgi:hypothetical protein
MNAQLQTILQPQTEPTQSQPQINIPRWNLAARIAFRFSMIYLGLYCYATEIFPGLFSATGGPGAALPDGATIWPLRPVISWTAAHIFHVNAPLSFDVNSGSCDGVFGWVTTFCVLMIATAATVVWSLLDRSRENYGELHKWFRLFVRLALAEELFGYGMVKVFLVQMRYPSLTRLVQPFGTFSPFGVFLNSIGSAPAYEIFTGSVMIAAGLLLIVPRTATLGALISLGATIEMFVLYMTYDVVAKLFSFHLILLCCFLLAPNVPRLVRFFLLHRTTSLPTEAQLFRGVRANRIALAAQIIFGLWLVGLACQQSWGYWNEVGGGRPLSALYGIWEVRQMSIDGQPRPPLLTDSTRWRRAIFEYTDRMAFQRIDESFVPYGASVNLPEKTLALTQSDDKNWTANFTFQRPAQDQLILDGRMDNHQVHMELQLTDRNKFLLVSRGFHWVQEFKLVPQP